MAPMRLGTVVSTYLVPAARAAPRYFDGTFLRERWTLR
jgi:hypothetical protein